MKIIATALLAIILFGGCKKDDPEETYNISATTWKGSHSSGGQTENETYIFNADKSFNGTTTLNGAPQAMTGGIWSQDRLKVSITNVSIASYANKFNIQAEISADHKKLTGTVTNTSNSATSWNINMTVQ